MLAPTRQLAILELVNRDGGVQLWRLAELFGVSTATVRRDLTMLESSGLVARVHGGAVRRPAPGHRRGPARSVASLQRTARAAIAADAARMVASGTTVALPAGPISEMLAQHLSTVPDLTAVTYSLPVAQAFRTHQHGSQALVLTGGLFGDTQNLTGPLSARAMRSLHIDTGFIEFDGVDADGRPANIDEATAELNRAVMAVAERTVCYMDHTAWHRTAAHKVTAPGSGQVLLIDAHVPSAVCNDLASSGMRVVVAHGTNPDSAHSTGPDLAHGTGPDVAHGARPDVAHGGRLDGAPAAVQRGDLGRC